MAFYVPLFISWISCPTAWTELFSRIVTRLRNYISCKILPELKYINFPHWISCLGECHKSSHIMYEWHPKMQNFSQHTHIEKACLLWQVIDIWNEVKNCIYNLNEEAKGGRAFFARHKYTSNYILGNSVISYWR